ncbi:MAG: T9SS type A sorting domain-containing protein [Bacteroidota bacterium]
MSTSFSLFCAGIPKITVPRFTSMVGVLLLALLPVRIYAQPGWTITPSNFAFDMIVLNASLTFDGIRSTDASDQVAVFVGSEVRGVGTLRERGAGTGVYTVSFQAYANASGETLSFKAYDASTDSVRDLCTELLFQGDVTRSGLDLHAVDASNPSACALNWQVVPGHVGDEMVFSGTLSIGGTLSTDPADRVAAFIGPEVRSIGTAGADGDGNQVYAFSLVGGATGQAITFQAHDASEGTTYTINEQITFGEGAHPGIVTLTTDAVLPVELSEFMAVVDGEQAVLRWTTASETNNAGFVVEHRPPTEHMWRAVTFVSGAGTTSDAQAYAHTLANLVAGVHHFRLKQVDYDGQFEYSPEVEATVEVTTPYALAAVYPNPFSDTACFTLAIQKEQQVRIAVYDALGRRVAELHDGYLASGAAHVYDLQGGLWPSGLYTVRVEADRFVTTRQFVVVK